MIPLSKLLIGMQCGGSDAFSGITSNPTAGYAADLLTALFSEVTEARDGIQFVAKRCIDDKTGQRLVQEMRWYDEYLRRGGVGREANTTPGNFMPELIEDVYRKFVSGNYKGAREAQFKLNPVRLAMDKASFPVAAKDMANIRGEDVGLPYLPNLPTTDKNTLTMFRNTMKEAGLI